MDETIYRCRECGAWAMDTLCGHCTRSSHGILYGRCKFCDRPMRRRGWAKISGWVNYGGKGYCVTHYQRINEAGNEEILDAELDAAVESYWANRDLARAGLTVERS